MNLKYNPYQCNRCVEMEYSYFDNCVHRYCKAFDCSMNFLDVASLKEKRVGCSKYNHKRGSKKKSKYLVKTEYLRKYPE